MAATATTTLAVVSRFYIHLFSILFNYLKLAASNFKWVLEFLLYHPFYSLGVRHHQPLHQEFQMVTEDGVEIWHPRRREGEREDEEEVDCAVCLNKISEGDEVKVLRCEHVFHRDCFNQWVGFRNFTCPLCRDFLGSGIRSVDGEGEGEAHVLFFKFSSFLDNNSERENWWLR